MKAGIMVATMFWTASLLGQYAGAPARDVRDAVRMLQETQRLMEPAIAGVRDEVTVLSMLVKAQNQLKRAQPASSFDEAVQVIDDFAAKRKDDATLSRDLERSIADARRILAVNRPILNVDAAREQLHHQVIHPLVREAMRNALDLQQLGQQLQGLQGRMVGQVLPEIYSATGFASVDPPE